MLNSKLREKREEEGENWWLKECERLEKTSFGQVFWRAIRDAAASLQATALAQLEPDIPRYVHYHTRPPAQQTRGSGPQSDTQSCFMCEAIG